MSAPPNDSSAVPTTLACFVVRDVRVHRLHGPAQAVDLVLGVPHGGRIDVSEDQRRAVDRQPPCDGTTETPPGTRHDRDFPGDGFPVVP
jgi:hypothetical protein